MSETTLNAFVTGPLTSSQERPLLCLEVNPPKGANLSPIINRLSGKIDGLDLFNVTDCALAKIRASSLPVASLLKREFNIEPLVNLSCRDRNALALQADLLSGWMLGVRSVIALTGDAMTIGDLPENKAVFEMNSIGLLGLINKLNKGSDIIDKPLNGNTDFTCGVVLNPNARNAGAEIKRLRKKIAAGAQYALTQPVFDIETATSFFADPFFSDTTEKQIPILLGLLPFKSHDSVRHIAEIPGIRIAEGVLAEVNALPQSALADWSVKRSMEIATSLRERVRGFHVISGSTPNLALELLTGLQAWR